MEVSVAFSRAKDYQCKADSVVSIVRRELSGVGLQTQPGSHGSLRLGWGLRFLQFSV